MILTGVGLDGQWRCVCRMGRGKKFGAPGGKLKHGEDMMARVREEVSEECHITNLCDVAHFTQLHVPGRVIEYPVEKWIELGYAAPRGYTHLWLSNSIINFFTAYTTETLTRSKPEGRDVVWLDLRPEAVRKTELKRIKAHHRKVFKLWLKSKETGIGAPGLVVYRPES